MSALRLIKRVPSAVTVETGFLYEHKLAFHKVGRKDGTGKCDAHHTGDTSDYLIGVIYRIDPEHRGSLDCVEGLGNGYEAGDVTITTLSDEHVSAFTYFATNINQYLKPFHWYKKHVIFGARENNFPHEYIDKILSVESIDDPDPDRAQRELNIYAT